MRICLRKALAAPCVLASLVGCSGAGRSTHDMDAAAALDGGAEASVAASDASALDAGPPAQDADTADTGSMPVDGGYDASSSSDCGTSVELRMQPGSLDAGYWYQFSLGVPGDGLWWYSVSTGDGGPLDIFPSWSNCAACGPVGDTIGRACSLLGDAGVSASWGGTAVVGTATCSFTAAGGDASATTTCQELECVLPGRYVAIMCASTSPGCAIADTCVKVPFDFPATGPIVGVLP